MNRQRFDLDSLDTEDPFEIDSDNWSHLYKHMLVGRQRPLRIGVEELRDYYAFGAVLYFPADPPADWLMTFDAEGTVVVVPLASPRCNDPLKCRPIGIYPAPRPLRDAYYRERERE